MITARELIPGAQLKPGDPRMTTIAVRQLDPDEEGGERNAVLVVEGAVQYVVWNVSWSQATGEAYTTNGTYVRFEADTEERAFLRALGDWLARF